MLAEYCIQTHGIYRECHNCTDDGRDGSEKHPPEYLTDIEESNDPEEQTHWQMGELPDSRLTRDYWHPMQQRKEQKRIGQRTLYIEARISTVAA